MTDQEVINELKRAAGKSPSLSRDEARHIEGYAAALQDMMAAITGGNSCDKHYDPMTVSEDGTMMHAYCFDMKDGGRHHPVSDYKDVAEIKTCLLVDSVRWIREGSGLNISKIHPATDAPKTAAAIALASDPDGAPEVCNLCAEFERKLNDAEIRHAALMLHVQTIVDEANSIRSAPKFDTRP